ncbi:hypothetical protein ACLB2K_022048 [Fragaria x ananassa]
MVNKHQWSSGRIVPCHGTDPGSIPGWHQIQKDHEYSIMMISQLDQGNGQMMLADEHMYKRGRHPTKTVQRLGILFPLLIIYLLFNLSYAVKAQDEKSVTNVGAIIDVDSRIGKQQKAAMEIAAENFNNQSKTDELILHFRDSGRDPFLAAYAAEHLIKEEKVQVIIGMETWQEAVTVADVVKNKNLSDDQVVPVISFAAPTITPPLIQHLWPFLIRMGSDVAAQMACIGDIVSAYYWKRVVVVYEDDGYGGSIGRLALLSETLRDRSSLSLAMYSLGHS